MEAKELRQMDTEGLKKKLEELEAEYFNLRFQHRTGQLENTSKIKQVRRDIARVKTVIREKNLA